MIIFFGTRSSKIQSRQINISSGCPKCKSQRHFSATHYGKYFHIFWIPIFSLGNGGVKMACSLCKNTFEYDELPQDIQDEIEASYKEKPPKKALEHNFGCFIIVGFVILMIFLFLYAIIASLFDSKESIAIDNEETMTVVYDEEPTYSWQYSLKNNMLNTDYSPDIEEDPYAHALKLCLDEPSLGLETSTTGYFADIHQWKFIMLIDAENIEILTEVQKEKLYKEINTCLDAIIGGKGYDRYIGIFSDRTFYSVETPEGIFRDGDKELKEKFEKYYREDDE